MQSCSSLLAWHIYLCLVAQSHCQDQLWTFICVITRKLVARSFVLIANWAARNRTEAAPIKVVLSWSHGSRQHGYKTYMFGGIGTLFARNFVQLTPVLRPSFLNVHFCHNTTCGTMDFSWYVDWGFFVCENVKSARNWREIVICNPWRDREILPFPRRNL